MIKVLDNYTLPSFLQHFFMTSIGLSHQICPLTLLQCTCVYTCVFFSGSGSGYFSCLAACMLGESGLSHGIDINTATVEHSVQCCKRWYNNIITKREAGESSLPTISKYVLHSHTRTYLDSAYVHSYNCEILYIQLCSDFYC